MNTWCWPQEINYLSGTAELLGSLQITSSNLSVENHDMHTGNETEVHVRQEPGCNETSSLEAAWEHSGRRASDLNSKMEGRKIVGPGLFFKTVSRCCVSCNICTLRFIWQNPLERHDKNSHCLFYFTFPFLEFWGKQAHEWSQNEKCQNWGNHIDMAQYTVQVKTGRMETLMVISNVMVMYY